MIQHGFIVDYSADNAGIDILARPAKLIIPRDFFVGEEFQINRIIRLKVAFLVLCNNLKYPECYLVALRDVAKFVPDRAQGKKRIDQISDGEMAARKLESASRKLTDDIGKTPVQEVWVANTTHQPTFSPCLKNIQGLNTLNNTMVFFQVMLHETSGEEVFDHFFISSQNPPIAKLSSRFSLPSSFVGIKSVWWNDTTAFFLPVNCPKTHHRIYTGKREEKTV